MKLFNALLFFALTYSPISHAANCSDSLAEENSSRTGIAALESYKLDQLVTPAALRDAMLNEYPQLTITEFKDRTFFVKIGVNQYRTAAGDLIELSNNEAAGFYQTHRELTINPLHAEEVFVVTKSVYNNGYGKLTTVIELRFRKDENSPSQLIAYFKDVAD